MTTTAVTNYANYDEFLARELELESDGFQLTPLRFAVEHRTRNFAGPDGQTMRQIRGVILKSQINRGYWKPGNPKPVCTSSDGIRGVDVNGTERQCAACPKNRFGTATRLNESGQVVPGRGKACKEMRRLLVLPNGYELPIILTVPPSSLRRFDEYASSLRMRRVPLIAIETTIRLEEAQADGMSFARLAFEAGDAVPREQVERLVALREEVLRRVDLSTVEDESEFGEPGEERVEEVPLDNIPF